MSDAVYASGGLVGPIILAEALGSSVKGEFAPSTFRGLDDEPVVRVEETIETAFALLCDRFDEIRDELPALDRSALRGRWGLELLGLLDWSPRYQQRHLKPHPLDSTTFPISHLGWDDPAAPPVHIEPTGAREGGLDARTEARAPSPHGVVQEFLNLAPQTWGVVTDGRELRILRDYHHSSTKAFIGFDLVAIFAGRDFEAFRGLYRLGHVSRFRAPDGELSPLERLYARSQAAGISAGRELYRSVRRAIELLAAGAVAEDSTLRDQLRDARQARTFYREVLQVVYRMLFILFAEQRGLLPGRDTLYAETYSLTRLRDIAETSGTVDGRRTDLYEGLKVTFRLMSQGSGAMAIAAFNGRLFDPSSTPAMTAAAIDNRTALRAVRALTSIQVDGHRQHVAYSQLGVEELGAVYERLLDYTPRIAEGPTLSDTGIEVPAGGLFLEPIGDRELGSYYTPPDLIAFTLDRSLDPLIAERLAVADGLPAKEAALLEIRTVDPACGSGAFLVAVIDRLAEALADVRQEGAQPTDRQLADARRDVLQNCIYGVDIDDFAVDLCRVALWIHCAVADMPLTFLDHRIQCGNSLMGWSLGNVPSEIPADAYQTRGKTHGDAATKDICASARTRNATALGGQGDLLTGAMPQLDLRLDHPELWREEERVPADVARKASAYADYLRSLPYRLWTAAADLWVASFFWTADYGALAPITTDYVAALARAQAFRDGILDDAAAERSLTADVVEQAGRLARQINAFHWPLRFPEIAERGGFDYVTGNPPWEVVKLNEREWFATRDAIIAGTEGDTRKRLIADLPNTNPSLAAAWRTASAAKAREAEFMRNSGRYARSGNEPNTYLLFAETDSRHVRPDGRAGVIVKSSLGTDKGGQGVLRALVDRGRVEGFYDIVNGGRGQRVIFPSVAEVERFAVVALGPDRPDSPGVTASMMNWSIDEAREREPVTVSRDDLRTLNPVTLTLPSFREPEHWRIALRLHERHPTLDFDRPTIAERENGRPEPTNPWGLRYATLFHSSGAAEHFLKRENLEADGWTLGDDMIFRRGDESALPLYEGQLATRYDHRARTFSGCPVEKKYGRKPAIRSVSDAAKADPSYEIEPRYWVATARAQDRLRDTLGHRQMVGLRDIGATWTNRRSARVTPLPPWPSTHTLPVIGVDADIFEFSAICNSTTFDFLVRGKMPGAHVALTWMLSQVAAPAPGLDRRLAENARKLSLTSHAVARLFNGAPHRWSAAERYVLDVETDAIVALEYGITRAEYAVILDTFDVLARAETTKHGRYRFKDDCLAAYGRLA